MRVIVFFDLPVVTASDKRNYNRFRKFLIRSGFVMMQNSVYSKLALNQTVADAVMKKVRTACPDEGIVQMLVITEKQYAKMEYVTGEAQSVVVDTTERLVYL